MLLERAISEIVRIIDIESSEIDYIVSKFRENWKFVNYEARTLFYKGATASILKYTSGFNHHINQYSMINKESTANECLQYLKVEN